MKNKSLRFLALALAALMMLTSVGYAETAWSHDDSATITILYAGDNTPDQDNIVLQEMEKQTGTNIDMMYVPTGEVNNKRSALIAAETPPDVFSLGLADATEMYEHGMLADMRPILEKVAPEVLELYGDSLEQVPLNKATGGIYMIPDQCIAAWKTVGMFIRQDWLNNLGLEVPTDLESFAKVMHAFTYDDPNQNGVDDTYGLCANFEVFKEWTSGRTIFGAYGIAMGNPYVQEDGTIASWIRHPNFLEAMKYFKSLIDDGVVEPDFMSIPKMDLFGRFWDGTAGAGDWWGHSALANWYPGRYVEDPLPDITYTVLEGPYGDKGVTASHPSYTGGYVVSSGCKNLEGVGRIIKYCMSNEGNDTLFLGVEGVMFEWVDKEAGTYRRLGDYTDDALHRQHGGWVYNELFRGGDPAEIRTMNKPAQEALTYFRSNEIEWPEILEVNYVDIEYGADMSQIVNEMLAELFQTEEKDMQAVYESYLSQWEDAGGLEWEKEATRLWNEQTNPN